MSTQQAWNELSERNIKINGYANTIALHKILVTVIHPEILPLLKNYISEFERGDADSFKWIAAPTKEEAEQWMLDTHYRGTYKIVTSYSHVQGARMRSDNVVLVNFVNLDIYMLEQIQLNILRTEYAK